MPFSAYYHAKVDTLPPPDPYYEEPYDPKARPPLPMDQHRRPPLDQRQKRPLHLYPKAYSQSLSIDTSMHYTLRQRIGGLDYRPPMRVPFEAYAQQRHQSTIRKYWQARSKALDGESPVSSRGSSPRIYVGPWLDRTFGGNFVAFEPNVLFTLDLSSRWDYIENPALPLNRRRNHLLDLKQQLSTNIVGKVGKKLDITFNYDTQSPFGSFSANFKNNVRIEYTGFEEDIVKKFVIGNVSMPLGNSLIRGSQNLFGIKTKLQFGRFYLTNVITTQRGSSDNLRIEDGTQNNTFSVPVSSYERDQYFFLSHFFRDNYEAWLEQRPQITSGVNITRVEVYVLNRSNEATNLRHVLAFLDLGEPVRIYRPNNSRIGSGTAEAPANNAANQLFASIQQESATLRNLESVDPILAQQWNLEKSTDYEKVTSARRLSENEYDFHANLGYLRLSRRLQNDEILAVSYEYTYNGERYKVGELSEDYQSLDHTQAIFLKMLRPSRVNTELTSWDLMMKNVYAIGHGNLSQEGFALQIRYRDDIRGLENPNLQEGADVQGRPLVELLGLDRLNPNNDPPKDGNFDYLENITVRSQQGIIIFPVLEPFGRTLRSYFDAHAEQALIEKYVYEALYRSTQDDAETLAEFNKYSLTGEYTTSGSSNGRIQLPAFGVVENSVQVRAGGQQLVEGQDYTVDYNFGLVTITNQSILASGKEIDISYEKNDFLSTRNRTLIGTRMDYELSEELKLGATLMYLTDQQGSISRYQLGNEPIRNLKYGLDAQWERESLFLTKMLDKLPLLSTKEPSSVRIGGEFAQLLPGTSNVVGKDRTFYIDDFEAATQPIFLGSFRSWQLAATPETPNHLFNKSNENEPLGVGYKRARIAWYAIDNEFYLRGSAVDRDKLGPGGTTNHYVRQIPPAEVFPFRDAALGVISEQVLNLAYFPSERGPYNYNPALDQRAQLLNPASNWGGIARNISNEVDFDRTNVEYLEFWLMDPFISGEKGRVMDGIYNQNNVTGGTLVFNLGDVSEDLIKDGRHGYENGLPADGSERGVVRTPWGRVTTTPIITRAFQNDAIARGHQDVGLDGLRNEHENAFFGNSFLSRLPAGVAQQLQADVSADNFSFYLGDELDTRQAGILERYKYFNNPEGNTPLLRERVVPIGSSAPDNEDLNQNNTISDLEAYYEYKVALSPNQLQVGRDYIVDQVSAPGQVNWYLFRIPISTPERVHGNISGFKSIRFIRMYLTGFEQPVVLRFVRMQLVSSHWNRYEQSLAEEDVSPGTNTTFTISSVGLEENNSSLPGKSPYVLPPGISRDENDFSFNQQRYNEQSLQICVEDLKDGDARAAFKDLRESLINYKRLRMFLHLHGSGLQEGDLQAFLRLGADYNQNYYEIAIPLVPTPEHLSGGGIDRLVWPQENEIDLALDELYAIKLRRDRENHSPTQRYMREVGKYKIYVIGRPRLSQVQTIMIGLRNPQSADNMTQAGCLWANELRSTGIDRKQGWAGNLRMDTQLADFADMSLSTQYSTPGFGEVQDRVQQRSLERYYAYDASSTMHLDKLIPTETGIKLPMFVSYEANKTTPEYDPLNSDVPLRVALLSMDEAERDQYEELATSFGQRRSINFTNVRKDRVRPEAKIQFFDIENFSFTYAYSDRLSKNISTDHEIYRHYRGNITYDFNTSAQYIEPLKHRFSHPYMGWLKDMNINVLPHNFSFSFDVDRKFQRKQLRAADLSTTGIDPVFEKSYTFDRSYGLQWNFFRSLLLHYDARASAIIDEPEGNISTEDRRLIWENILKLGRMKRYTQDAGAEYTVPLSKFPILDWTSTSIHYQAAYVWNAGSLDQISTLGNAIENTREWGGNISLDMGKLYGKSPFLSTSSEAQKGLLGGALNFLTMLKSINAHFTRQAKTLLPGFLPRPEWLGTELRKNAPGWDFILGSQDPGIRLRAANKGWLVRNSELTLPFRQQLSEEIGLQATITPISDISIQLSADRRSSAGYEEIFRYEEDHNEYTSLTPSRNGTYSMSFLSIATSFGSDKGSAVFSDLSEYRKVIKARLDAENPVGTYHLNAQDVLIPAFVAAYSKRDPNKVRLNPFPKIPLPNWHISYQGLNKIKALSNLFASIALTHGYTSSYAVGNFSSSLLYDNLYLQHGLLLYRPASLFENGKLVPFYAINGVGISESFAPLLGVNMSFRNNTSVRIEFRKSREVNLNISNAQLNEGRSHDVSVDYSYSKDKFRVPFNLLGRNRVLENTLTFRLGFALRNMQDTQRILDADDLVTGGNISLQYRGSVDYALNRFLNLQMYVERNTDEPRLTTAFPRRRTGIGFRLRLNWSE